MSANAIVDGNPETMWAKAISPGLDTTIKVNLHGLYKVKEFERLDFPATYGHTLISHIFELSWLKL